MFDKELKERLEKMCKPEPVEVGTRPRLSIPALSGMVQSVVSEADAEAMAARLMRLPVSFLALEVLPREAGHLGGLAAGLSGSPSLAMGLVAIVPEAATGRLLAVRYALDVRAEGVAANLKRVLGMPVRLVVHCLATAFLALRSLDIAWPRAAFSTQLAARLLTLGRHHVRYEADSGAADDEEAAARAKDKRAGAVDLLHLAREHGVAVPPAVNLDGVRERLLGAGPGAPLSAQDAQALSASACAVAGLHLPLRTALAAAGLDWHYDNVELPGAVALAEVQRQGVTVSSERIQLAQKAAERAVSEYAAQLISYGVTRPRSMEDRRHALARLGLLHHFKREDTASGYSFDEDALELCRNVHPVVDLLYRFDRFSHVVDERLFAGDFTESDGRIHPRVHVLGAESGRPTFKDGNLVGVGRIFRPVVRPDGDGFGLVELDYKAQEVFIAAAHFGDDVLLEDCNSGDPYVRMVRELCSTELAPEEADLDDESLARAHPDLRTRMKLLVLAMMYGMTDASIAAQAGTDLAGARQLRERFFQRYSALKTGMERAVEQLVVRGYAEGITGLKRFRGKTGPLSGWERRWAVNTVIQGGGACILKLLLPPLAAYLGRLGGRVVLPIFDAVLIQVPLIEGMVPSGIVDGARGLMVEAMRELYPATRPRVDVNDADPSCWNKDGHSNSIERFLADPMFKL
ncbi:DNA polymerase [Myxococcus sp. Y35]|uniref:DNA polymerase n=1 Tax=Pseudomyxococcus flavus TaxID=3115648 RepID=UPI003CFA9374